MCVAFLVPVLEKLYRARWDAEDGLGALIISPTRELALQIFEVLRSIGKLHSFSAGLIIGGKNFYEEQHKIIRMNILIATPGRLLQHMEQTPGFEPSNLQVLVLDEADRILDMGFSSQLTSIVSYLPKERQTMLFSATQTKSVKDLAKLSLKDPEYIAVHEKSEFSTPKALDQKYLVCAMESKLDILFSFIKAHLKQKTIVFASSCRQVRFVYDAFCKMQPGLPLMALHGKYKQGKRVEIYYNFLNKPAAVMFATDIASRGLDFPSVDWVFQLDCPEDAASYIHRVGRTARYNRNGHAMTLVLPSEVEGMTSEWRKANIPITEAKINPKKTLNTKQKIRSIVAASVDTKLLAQKAYMSYIRSYYLQPNKSIFQIDEFDTAGFAASLGLASAPKVKFMEATRQDLRKKKNVNQKLHNLKTKIKAEKAAKKAQKQEAAPKAESTDGSDVEDSLMVVKNVHDWSKVEPVEEQPESLPRKKRKIRVDDTNHSKVVFDDAGNSKTPFEALASAGPQISNVQEKSNEYAAKVVDRLRSRDELDREQERERVRAKHTKRRNKLKGEKAGDEAIVQLGGSDDESDVNSAASDDNAASDGTEASDDESPESVALRLLQNRS